MYTSVADTYIYYRALLFKKIIVVANLPPLKRNGGLINHRV